MDGFSYNGVHCSEFGIGYIPSPAARLPEHPDYSLIESTVTGRHGGYCHGNQIDIREFEQECYVDGITTETFEKMYQWLHRDGKGKLIFDEKPFAYYIVQPSQKPKGKIYPMGNSNEGSVDTVLWGGTLTLYFKAYDPLAYLAYTSYDEYDMEGASIYSGMIPTSEMPDQITSSVGDYLVYNPGTEATDTIIRIGGKAPNGVTITNQTTGDRCVLLTLPDDGYLELDSQAGSVSHSLATSGFAFEYHDEGFITLAPCTPYRRNIVIKYTRESNVITSQVSLFTDDFVGRYVRLNGSWVRIIYVTDKNTAVINAYMGRTATENTMIAVMNQISIEGTDAELSVFEVEYRPRIS